jgi:hypothetical protein
MHAIYTYNNTILIFITYHTEFHIKIRVEHHKYVFEITLSAFKIRRWLHSNYRIVTRVRTYLMYRDQILQLKKDPDGLLDFIEWVRYIQGVMLGGGGMSTGGRPGHDGVA